VSRISIPIVAAEALEATGTPAQPAQAARQRQREAPRGRQVDAAVLAWVQQCCGPVAPRRDQLIEALHRLNDELGALPAPHLVALAHFMRLAVVEVFEVASFYHHFEVLKEDAQGVLPAATPLTVRVCEGLSCQLAGARALAAQLPALLGREVRVIAAPCVGRCEAAPVAVVHQHAVAPATAAAVVALVQQGRREAQVPAAQRLAAYRSQGGYALWQACVAGVHAADDIIAMLEQAGLRGLGGAGFPAARKWRAVRAQPGPRLLAVNIDEGEPGTFKDRWFLEREPHRFIEGLLVACWAVGVQAVYIYLRDEYHGIRVLLQQELQALQGTPGLPPLPAIELRRGAGAYICGEESAMIESIEGKRGLPRLRPPYVAEVGTTSRPCTGCATSCKAAQWPGPPRAGAGAPACAVFRSAGACVSQVSNVRRPASRCVSWWTNTAAACCRATSSMPTCPAAPRAASCRRGWAMCRWTSTRCSRMAASSALPRSSCCRSTTARSMRRAR